MHIATDKGSKHSEVERPIITKELQKMKGRSEKAQGRRGTDGELFGDEADLQQSSFIK